MDRAALAHIIRAAAEVSGEPAIVIIGSQAILAAYSSESLPEETVRSIEADVAFLDDPEERKSDLVDGAIGEGSLFHETHGYYAHGVSIETAVLPTGWHGRAIRFDHADPGAGEAVCLEVHDLAISKLVAGREKDFEFVQVLLDEGILRLDTLIERIDELSAPGAVKRRLGEWVERRG